MTSRSTWKKRERNIAKYLGTDRTPLSGSNSRHTSSDTLSDIFYVESKLRVSPPGWALFEQTALKASKENKIPLVIYSKKFKQKKQIVCDYDWLIEIIKRLYIES